MEQEKKALQAVVLAAGKGTRMHPLRQPKPLLKIAGKTVLEHTLSCLEGFEEVIIVVGHEGDKIKEFLEKGNFKSRISTVEQKSQKGTFDALLQARPLLKGKFLVMNGDDIYSKEDISSSMSHELCILAREVEDFRRFGILETRNSFLSRIIEKPRDSNSRLANTGLFVLNKEIFDSVPEKSERGEFELTDAVNKLAEKRQIAVEKSSSWIPIGYPWSLLEANEILLKGLKGEINGKVEGSTTLKGNVSIGKGSLVKSGACIEGPVSIGENCIIGPNCFIRPFTSIGNSCKIGSAVELKNSILGDNVSIGHLSYFGDSILGSNINIGAGTIAANLRHDKETVKVQVNSSMVDTKRRKFGCIIGDSVHTGIHTSICPGRKLEKNTLPGEVVK